MVVHAGRGAFEALSPFVRPFAPKKLRRRYAAGVVVVPTGPVAARDESLPNTLCKVVHWAVKAQTVGPPCVVPTQSQSALYVRPYLALRHGWVSLRPCHLHPYADSQCPQLLKVVQLGPR